MKANPDYYTERLSGFNHADVLDLSNLVHQESPWNEYFELTRGFMREMVAFPTERTLVVARDRRDDRIVGAETLNKIVSPDIGKIGKTAYLGFVVTRGNLRRRGIATMVWAAGLDWCDEQGVPTIRWRSNPDDRPEAQAFYKSVGGVPADTTPFNLSVEDSRAMLAGRRH